MTEEHEPYIWAAYKRGCFDSVEEGLNEKAFDRQFWHYLTLIERNNSQLWAVMAKVKDRGTIPVGLVGVHFDGNLAFPHVDWFPEATPRIKIEGGVRFISQLKRDYLVIITGPKKWESYWRHLAHYGLLRWVGEYKDFYGKDEHAPTFQSVGH